jgi:hypothetical protein
LKSSFAAGISFQKAPFSDRRRTPALDIHRHSCADFLKPRTRKNPNTRFLKIPYDYNLSTQILQVNYRTFKEQNLIEFLLGAQKEPKNRKRDA